MFRGITGKSNSNSGISAFKFVRGKGISKTEKERSGSEEGNQKKMVALKSKMVNFTLYP